MLSALLALVLNTASLSEEAGIRRVQAHLIIQDVQSAKEEAAMLYDLYPDSIEIRKTFIEALSHAGLEKEAFEHWHEMTYNYPNLLYDRNLLEELSWGVLRNGLSSSQFGVRLAALIGSFLTRDVRAVPIIRKMMRDSNALIRSIAIQMASQYRDAPLKDEISRLIKEERVWMVRLEAIKAAGILQLKEAAPLLEKIVQSKRTMLQERQIAIEALLTMYDDISLERLEQMVKSDRAGLRHLAASMILHFERKDAEELLLLLLNDTNPAVRVNAQTAYALLFERAFEPLLDDPDPAVAITAAWALSLTGDEAGLKRLDRWAFDTLGESRRLAAAAIASLGNRGVHLSHQILKKSEDPYVRVTLALGLLGQRAHIQDVSDCIVDFLEGQKRLIMMDRANHPIFASVAPSQVRYQDQIPNFPEAHDQMTRLELISQLAIIEDPRALPSIRKFLAHKAWGISGFAAELLIHEGDDEAMDVVKELTFDKDPNIRLQAALVLAMFGKDESVLNELQGAYSMQTHEKKLLILEAIGRIGNTHSFSFLAGNLKEPFPILRIAAAAALIQSVNR